MGKFVNTINEFCSDLKSNGIVHFEKHRFNDEFMDISDNDLTDTLKMFSSFEYQVDKNYYDLFRISNMSYSWSYTNEKNQFIYGGFLFNGILDLFVQDSDFWNVFNSINRHEPDEKELKMLKDLNWFEKQSWGDDGKFGCFLRESGKFPPKIYFYDYGAFFPTSMSIEQYFNAMIESCAVRGWQYFYIDISANFPQLPKVNKELVLQDADFIVEMLPKLFPDKDFGHHKRRLLYLEDKLK